MDALHPFRNLNFLRAFRQAFHALYARSGTRFLLLEMIVKFLRLIDISVYDTIIVNSHVYRDFYAMRTRHAILAGGAWNWFDLEILLTDAIDEGKFLLRHRSDR